MLTFWNALLLFITSFWGWESLVELSDHFSQFCIIVNYCNSYVLLVGIESFTNFWYKICFVLWERVCLVCIFSRGFCHSFSHTWSRISPRFVKVNWGDWEFNCYNSWRCGGGWFRPFWASHRARVGGPSVDPGDGQHRRGSKQCNEWGLSPVPTKSSDLGAEP